MITKDIPINDTLTKTSFYDAIGNIHSELRLMVSTMGKILSGLAPDAPSVSPSPPSQTSSAATRLQDVFPFGYYVFSNKEGRWTYEATPEADKLQYHIDPNEVQIEPDFANRTVHWKIPYSAKRQNGRGMIYVNNTLVATVPMVKPHSSSGVVNPIFSVGVVVEANQPSFFVVTLDDDQRFPVFALGFRIPEKPTPPAHALTNEELVKRLFPKPIRRHVRKVAASKPKGK